MSVDAETLAATVREGMDAGGDFLYEPVGVAANQALDALVALVAAERRSREQAEQERDEWKRTHDIAARDWREERENRKRAAERAEAAEAECARLEQEAVPYELVLLLEAEQLEVQRLREERDTLTERDYWASQTIREYERELVRLRERWEPPDPEFADQFSPQGEGEA